MQQLIILLQLEVKTVGCSVTTSEITSIDHL
jgi:hypothetical protein